MHGLYQIFHHGEIWRVVFHSTISKHIQKEMTSWSLYDKCRESAIFMSKITNARAHSSWELEGIDDRTQVDSGRFTGRSFQSTDLWAAFHTAEMFLLGEYVDIEFERGGMESNVWFMISEGVENSLVRIIHSFSPGFLWVTLVKDDIGCVNLMVWVLHEVRVRRVSHLWLAVVLAIGPLISLVRNSNMDMPLMYQPYRSYLTFHDLFEQKKDSDWTGRFSQQLGNTDMLWSGVSTHPNSMTAVTQGALAATQWFVNQSTRSIFWWSAVRPTDRISDSDKKADSVADNIPTLTLVKGRKTCMSACNPHR